VNTLFCLKIGQSGMTDKDQNQVQRFSRRNRKDNLPKTGSLFPAEEPIPAAAPEPEKPAPPDFTPPVELDLAALSLLNTDRDALENLSKLAPGEIKAPFITPQEERYPPLNPAEQTVPHTPTIDPVQVQKVKTRKRRNLFYNLLTLLLWVGIIGFIVWFVTVWKNPQTVWNPLPPATPFAIITATPGNAPENAFAPTANADGQVFVVATEAATATPVVTDSPYPFIVPESVLHVPNGNDLRCNWWSIAGTVTDNNGGAINGYRIRVTGDGVNESVFSGTILTFGAGGFELPMIGTPQIAEFTVQLFSPQDAPLSAPVTVTTRAECDANVAIVNFVQNR
jgi:hypothetical protein